MPIHNTEGGASIFFAKTPDFGQLCSIVCQLQQSTQSAAPGFHIHSFGLPNDGKVGQSNILKCRELIFTEPSVLASPSLQEEGHIYVILSRPFWLSGKFQERCQKMGLQYCKPMRVIPAVFQACFTYTLKAKLAPLWNKVGEYYVQGRDFITATGYLGAIGLETNVTDGEICLAIKPMTVQFSHCILQDFGVCPPIISHFLCDPNYIISEYSVDDKFCYVLPSMKKGQVVSLMHSLPAASPFKSYSELRRYWKNTYGYRLPESGHGIVYINIFFPAIKDTIFTYPEFCIRKKEARHIPRMDSTPVLQAFLADIRRKVPQICESPLEVTRKPQYTAVTMNSASGQIGSTNLSSLTLVSKPSTMAQRIPTRSLVSIVDGCSNHPGCVGQMSPYRPLSGQTSAASNNTGYTLKMTPTLSRNPCVPQGVSGYSNDRNQAARCVRNHLSYQAESHKQSVLSTGSQSTRVTPAEHWHHQHHPSPRMPPLAPDNRFAPCPPQNSPVPQGCVPYGAPPGYSSPYAEAQQPCTQASPSPNNALGTVGWKHPQEITASVQVASRSAAEQNHTMFSLAVHLRNQIPQNAADRPPQQYNPPPSYHVEQTRTDVVVQDNRDDSGVMQYQSSLTRESRASWSQDSNLHKWPPRVTPAAPAAPPSKPFVPIFNPKPTRSYTPTAGTVQVSTGPRIKPTFAPHKPKSVPPSTFLSHAGATRTRAQPAVPSHQSSRSPSPSDLIICEDVIPPTQPQLQRYQQPHSTTLQKQRQQQIPSPSPSSLHPPTQRHAPSFGAGTASKFKPVIPASLHQAMVTTTTDSPVSASKKRKPKDPSTPGDAKKSKPRSKPKVQEDIDVHQMAQNNQLSKVNIITLLTWLKEKGVAATSKEKKQDLVAKVMGIINCTAKEA